MPVVFATGGVPLRSLLQEGVKGDSEAPATFQIHPEYRVKRGIDAVLRKLPAGHDDFVTEKYQDEIEAVLRAWSAELHTEPGGMEALRKVVAPEFFGAEMRSGQASVAYRSATIQTWRVKYAIEATLGAEGFFGGLRASLAAFSKLHVAEFQIVSIHADSANAGVIPVTTVVRYEFVGEGSGFHREQRVGHWELRWERRDTGEVRLTKWSAREEQKARSIAPVFQDVTERAFGGNASYREQLVPGTDYWRTVVDGASGIDIYGHNGVAVGDADGDGLEDVYVCQPAGLPNRLFRNKGDGTFEDVTDAAGVGVLENSACALFADVDNDGRQDLIVVRANGPLLFLNQGGGKFGLKKNAFQFAQAPQGTFTGAAMADYDRDGWLDIYFCLYSYYQGADQYRYPMPYFDAENGPPNFLMKNNRDGTFGDATKASGMERNNTRFSFCCAWGDVDGDGWPDLYVVNDFGRKNLYRNNQDGTFTDVAKDEGVEDVGAGMSGAWTDLDNDGREDLYVANMWTAAGIRVSEQANFQRDAGAEARGYYQQHAMGNCLYRNKGGHFEDMSMSSGAAMGRWAWSSDVWDFDHDGYPDIYIANGMVTGTTREDLNSFFWRQVVANSPNEARPNHEYEQAWNAINDLIRSDWTWSGFERNLLYLNNHDGTFSDVSGICGMDFGEDGRTFALADLDGDGRQEVLLKNRNSPQLRYLKNVMPELPGAISFRLIGKNSNRDAVGARITIETKAGRQTKFVQCGSGFLAQHSKEVFFGLGSASGAVTAEILWPSGLAQRLEELPANSRIWVDEGLKPTRIEQYGEPAGVGKGPAPVRAERLPETVETWLLVPVPAPEFALTGSAGRVETLSGQRGKVGVVYLFSGGHTDDAALDEIAELQKIWSKAGVALLAIDVDGSGGARRKPDAFPVLAGTADVIATYNLLFRQLFDRHRDMRVPVCFLVDAQGNVVKIYQGTAPNRAMEKDFASIPTNDSERRKKALPFAGLQETYEYERNYLSLGFVYYERGYFEQAEQFFGRAAKEDAGSAEALYGLGSAYLQLQKTAEARECFERALAAHATYPGTLPNCWNNLGILAAREGNADEAIGDFQNALKIDPQHSIALQNLGSAYRQKKDWPAAKRALEQALALNPEDAEANYTLGMVYAQQGDTEHAQEYLQKAIAARPAYPEALNNLGILYLRTRRAAEAVKSFEESIRVAPGYDQAYLNLARVYAIQGDRGKAKEVLQDLLKQHPGHPQGTAELQQVE